MWRFKQKVPIKQFIPMMVKMKNGQAAKLRFVLYQNNLVYLATQDTFGDVMPNNLTPNTFISIWEKWA